MFQTYFNKFVGNFFLYALYTVPFGGPLIVYSAFQYSVFIGACLLAVFLFVVSYGTFEDVKKDEVSDVKRENANYAYKLNEELNGYKNKIDGIEKEAKEQIEKAEERANVAMKKEDVWKRLLKERASGFPTLLSIIAQYEENVDDYFAGWFASKPHPALKASEVIKEESRKRRMAEFLQRKTQSIIEYYENIAPFLLDFKEQEIDETEDALRDYSEEERQDPITNYLTKEEYRKLSSTERNQMALERYWKRPKSKWLIGRIYERYVGYLFECKGYDVEYVGIFKGYEDLGRDLICHKGKDIIIVQCKYWSQFKTIFEKHIFQFFGTVFQYRDHYKKNNVEGMFVTSTELSEIARRFAKELGISLREKFKMDQNYPCIKCNISEVDKSKIYHLPFDQQYDNVKIEPKKGEFYCATVEEAEKKGFRRAYRWKGKGGV